MEKKWWHDKVAYQIYPETFMVLQMVMELEIYGELSISLII